MSDSVRRHYETWPYPLYPLLASLRRHDTYALNLEALWARFNGALIPEGKKRILIAGCGSFAPYPFALANPDANITALDLSRRNLRRARLHCLLHGRTNVSFLAGDLLDPAVAPGPFGLIDAFGVLHHLEEPVEGFKALAARLDEGGILRVMVYSRYARREEDSIRRAFRLLGVRDPATAKRMISRARPGSRLRDFDRSSYEARSSSGLADALLHPRALSFRIDELMEMVHACGLQPLLFIHQGALPGISQELERIRAMETRKESPGNFVLFLGRAANVTPPEHIGANVSNNVFDVLPPLQGEGRGGDGVSSTLLANRSLSAVSERSRGEVEGNQPHPHPNLPLEGEGTKSSKFGPMPPKPPSMLLLNPCLRGCVGRFRFGSIVIPDRLGNPNPLLGMGERAFLRRFLGPVAKDSLPPAEQSAADIYIRSLFLLQYRP